jgi:hypothetical protein
LGLPSSTLPRSIDADYSCTTTSLWWTCRWLNAHKLIGNWIIQLVGLFYESTFVVEHRILLQMFRVGSHSDNLSIPSDACGTLVPHAMWRRWPLFLYEMGPSFNLS